MLRISRGSLYYDPCPVSAADLAIMRRSNCPAAPRGALLSRRASRLRLSSLSTSRPDRGSCAADDQTDTRFRRYIREQFRLVPKYPPHHPLRFQTSIRESCSADSREGKAFYVCWRGARASSSGFRGHPQSTVRRARSARESATFWATGFELACQRYNLRSTPPIEAPGTARRR